MGRPVPTETLFWSLQPLERPVPTETLFWALQPLESLHSPGGRPASQPFLPPFVCTPALFLRAGGRPASQPLFASILRADGRPPGEWGQKGLACWLAGRPSARRMEPSARRMEAKRAGVQTKYAEAGWQKRLAGRPSARRKEAFQRLQSPEKCLSRNRPFQRLQRPEKCLSRNRPSQRLRDLNYET